MPERVLDPQQSELIATAGTPIRVLDASGRDVGVLTLTAQPDDAPRSMMIEEIEELARRAPDPRRDWPTTQEVLARIKSRVSSSPARHSATIQ
jgi:hypothetical protein